MHYREIAFVAGVTAILSLMPQPVSAQAKPESSTKQNWTLPRTSDGQPDLQGIWANNNATPLERPKELAGRARSDRRGSGGHEKEGRRTLRRQGRRLLRR